MKKALLCGILASMFFAFTFILNRSMNLTGGYWMWSASLRYLFTLPILAIVLYRTPGNGFHTVWQAIKKNPAAWLLWSTVGFGFFYLPIPLASLFGESWLVAASWQVTIVCGVLLTPLFGKKIPVKNLGLSFVILIGIFVMQSSHFSGQNLKNNLLALIPILIAAFAYPLGNRKMMQYCPEEITTIQRVFGMTLCSTPFWLLVSAAAFQRAGAPSAGQLMQSFGVALFSGVIATILFFHATDLVKENPKQLAVVEATQCGEVIFTLIGGILILGDAVPDPMGILGLGMILFGMIANSLIS